NTETSLSKCTNNDIIISVTVDITSSTDRQTKSILQCCAENHCTSNTTAEYVRQENIPHVTCATAIQNIHSACTVGSRHADNNISECVIIHITRIAHSPTSQIGWL